MWKCDNVIMWKCENVKIDNVKIKFITLVSL